MDSKGNEKKSCKDVKRNKKVHLLHFSFQEKGIERQRTGNKYQILKSYIIYDQLIISQCILNESRL